MFGSVFKSIRFVVSKWRPNSPFRVLFKKISELRRHEMYLFRKWRTKLIKKLIPYLKQSDFKLMRFRCRKLLKHTTHIL